MNCKTPVITWTLIILVMLSTSIAESAHRKFIYKMEHGKILLRTCISGKINNQRDCVGTSSENRIDPYYFKQALLSPYLIIDSDKLKPLSKDDRKAYKASGINPSEIIQKRKSNLIYKLSLIKKFLQKNIKQKASLKILILAEKQLVSSDPSETHTLKLNKLIQKAYENRIKSNKNNSVIESETPESRIFWRSFDASIRECGTKNNQTIKQSIASCSTSITARKNSKKPVLWKLVARKRSHHNGKFYEVWKDSQTGLLWGDLFDKPMPYFYLVDLGKNGKIIKDKICSSSQYSIARAGIAQQKFFLPTITEFEKAIENGINEVAPNMNNWYWSATSFPNEHDDIAWGISNGLNQFRDFDFKYYYSSVRCVGRGQPGT